MAALGGRHPALGNPQTSRDRSSPRPGQIPSPAGRHRNAEGPQEPAAEGGGEGEPGGYGRMPLQISQAKETN